MDKGGLELSRFNVDESLGKHNKMSPLKRKLSLESTSLNQKCVNDRTAKESFTDDLMGHQIEGIAPNQQPAENFNKYKENGKLHNPNRKLSLESSSRNQKISAQCKDNVLSYQCSPVLKPKEAGIGFMESVLVEKDVNQYKQKSHQLHKSGDVESASVTNKGSEKICMDQNRASIGDKTSPQSLSVNTSSERSLSLLPMPFNTSHCDKQPQKDCLDKIGSGLPSTEHKRLGLAGRKQSLGLATSLLSREKDNKENMISVSGVLLPNTEIGESNLGKVVNSNTNVYHKKQLGIRRRLPLQPLEKSNCSDDGNMQLSLFDDNLNGYPSKLLLETEDSRHIQKRMQENNDICTGKIEHHSEVLPISDSAVVLDSEDSDDEKSITVRPKLSFTRKRVVGKWKVKA